jgi:methylglutaconyl-CoA hydratase
MSQLIKLERSGAIVEMVLCHDEKRNALGPEMLTQMSKALDEISAMADVKILLLRSEGSVFSAGADIEHMKNLSQFDYEQNLEDSHNMRVVFDKLLFMQKIVISVVAGPALAGGCGLANLADFVWASESATFGFPEVKIGFVPALVSIYLRKRIRGSAIRELTLSGEIISSTTAKEIGMVNKVVSDDALLTEVRAYALQLVDNVSLQAAIMTKSLLLDTHSMPRGEALDYAEDVNARSRETEDWQKGINAFLNKEPQKWN